MKGGAYMRVKERILTIRLIEMSKSNPDFLKEIGVLVNPSIESTPCGEAFADNIESGVSAGN